MSQNTTGLAFGRPVDAELVDARLELVVHHAGLRETGEIAFDVGEEHRHAELGETFGEHHQRHRFAGAGRARDHAVAVGVLAEQVDVLVALADQDLAHVRIQPARDDARDCSDDPPRRLPHPDKEGKLRQPPPDRISMQPIHRLATTAVVRDAYRLRRDRRRAAPQPPAAKVDDASLNALYARLDQDSNALRERPRSRARRQERSGASRNRRRARRSARRGHALRRHLRMRAAALRRRVRSAAAPEHRQPRRPGRRRRHQRRHARSGATRPARRSPVVAAVPELGRSLTLLKGRELGDVIAMNDPVKAALEEWLTQYRPNLIDGVRQLPVHALPDVARIREGRSARSVAVRHAGQGIRRQGARGVAFGRVRPAAVHVCDRTCASASARSTASISVSIRNSRRARTRRISTSSSRSSTTSSSS